jgi:large subunit ribosomal protein L7/L12
MAEITSKDIIKKIEEMSVLELSQLVKELEDKFQVSPMAAIPAAAAAPAAAATQEEEKTEFSVILTSFGDKKINVIKVVREVTDLGLKEAKDLVDNVPKPVKEGISKKEAEELKEKFEKAGAQAEIK